MSNFAYAMEYAAHHIHQLGAYRVELEIFGTVQGTEAKKLSLNGNPGISPQAPHPQFRFTKLEEMAKGIANKAFITGVGGRQAASLRVTWQPGQTPVSL